MTIKQTNAWATVGMSLAALLVTVGLLDAKGRKDHAKTRDIGAVTYDFNPIRKWPGWFTSRMTIRSDRKLRPIYFSGKNEQGKVTVNFADTEGLDDFVGVEGLAPLLGSVKVTGSAEIILPEITLDSSDLDRFAMADLLKKNSGLVAKVVVTGLTQWKPVTDKKRKKARGESYTATLKAKLVFAEKVGKRRKRKPRKLKELASVDVEAEGAKVIFADAVASTEGSSPAKMYIRANFTVKGKQLGLGDDAGDLSVYFMCVGYTDYSGEARKHIQDIKLDAPNITAD
jgi:hypothetical protein